MKRGIAALAGVAGLIVFLALGAPPGKGAGAPAAGAPAPGAPAAGATAQGAAVPTGFGPPLGAHDGVSYGPRVMEETGKIIEDTNYDVQNPDLRGDTCFGVAWEKLWHAGQDLYRTDGKSTAGAVVTAIGDARVAYANPDINYPGLVVILEHEVDGGKLYSVYSHLDDNSLEVGEGETVKAGQAFGTVLKQRYTGRFPARHPSGDDSHLHFEIRRFLSARTIYTAAPACNGLVAGRGYTWPQRPDDFPQRDAGYVDPALVSPTAEAPAGTAPSG